MLPGDVAHDDMVEALASPRRSRRGSNRLCVHSGDGGCDVCQDRIAIVDKISRRLGLRKSIAQLLCRPGRRRMFGDRHVNDSSTVVREDDEHEEEFGRCPSARRRGRP